MMTTATEIKKVTCLGGVSRNIVLSSLEKPIVQALAEACTVALAAFVGGLLMS